MIKVGITGGIGSGKTTICKIFETLGINCYYADNKAKNIINQKEVSDNILSYFGDIIYYNGTLNKIKLRDIVFNNPEKLDILNNIIHPYVFKDFENWLNLQI
jgi:dephospho-CoA kinase